MTSVFAFEQADLPKAERFVAAGVEDVYRVIEAVDGWSSWVDGIVAPVRVHEGPAFEVSWIRDGRMTTHHVAITARGPFHTLSAEVDQHFRVHVRTRPLRSGTHVEVVVEPLGKPRRRGQWFRRRRVVKCSAVLSSFLDQLAAHVEDRRESKDDS